MTKLTEAFRSFVVMVLKSAEDIEGVSLDNQKLEPSSNLFISDKKTQFRFPHNPKSRNEFFNNKNVPKAILGILLYFTCWFKKNLQVKDAISDIFTNSK